MAHGILDPTNVTNPLHPYYPLGVDVVGYAPNEFSVPTLLSIFAGGCSVIFSATYVIAKGARPSLSNGDLVTIMWFVLCKEPWNR